MRFRLDGAYINITRIEASGRNVQPGDFFLRGGIVDDDTLIINVGNHEQLEGTGGDFTEFNVPVTLGNQVESGVSIQFQTVDYTAGALENDFPSQLPVVNFAQEEASKPVTAKITQDDKREANEKFTVHVTSAWAIWGDVPIQYNVTPVEGPQGNVYLEPFGLITIKNDDEGIYTNTGGGSVGFYNGQDPDLGGGFKTEAEAQYSPSFDVGSWGELIGELKAHVIANGRVSGIGIFDHGNESGQYVGGLVSRSGFEDLAPFLNDGAAIWLVGCNVGKNNHYNDWIADDAGPGAKVKAANAYVQYPGLWLSWDFAGLNPGGEWLTFDGYQKP